MNANVLSSFSKEKRLITPTRSSLPPASGQYCWRPWIHSPKPGLTAPLLALLILVAGLCEAVAQPTLISTVPDDGATGVSPSAAVVFTFSTNMDTTMTTVDFQDVTGDYGSPSLSMVWSAGNKVLTCTPSPQFANNHEIDWIVDGQDTMGNYLYAAGGFTTVPGVGGGSGTNAITTFVVGKLWYYIQTSPSPPALSTFAFLPPYEFSAQTMLSSNRAATNVTVTIPVTSGVSNLVQDSLAPESFDLNGGSTNLTTFNTTFPSGNYAFKVSATTSNQQVTVTLPVVTQPNAPQVSNYTAAQAINPSQSFTLTWNAFTGGSSSDWILLKIIGDSHPIFQTPDYGQTGALTGTSTSVTIPAGTFQPGSNYVAVLVFYRGTVTSGGTIKSEAYAGSLDYFTINTTAGSPVTPGPVLTIIRSGTNALVAWPTNATGYTLQFSTNLASSVWNTNLPAPVIINTNKVVTNSIAGTARFFRLSNP